MRPKAPHRTGHKETSSRLRSSDGPRYLIRLPIRCRSEVFLVPVSHIAAIVADGEKLTVTTTSNTVYTFSDRLRNLEARLDPEQFIRLSRAILVNVTAVSKISLKPNGTHVFALGNGQTLRASRIQSRRFRQTLFRW